MDTYGDWALSPDGRRLCNECGQWSYEDHKPWCQYAEPPPTPDEIAAALAPFALGAEAEEGGE